MIFAHNPYGLLFPFLQSFLAGVWKDFTFHLCYSIIGIVFRKNRSDFFFSFFVPTFTHKKATFPTKQNTLYIETFKHLMYFLYLMRLSFLIISNCDQAEFYKSQGKKVSAFTENSFYFSLHFKD